MKQLFHFFLCLCLASPVFGKNRSSAVAKKKRQAIQRLDARKKAFDQHIARKKKWNQQRRAVAFKQKEIRKRYSEKRDKARREFTRPKRSFPIKDYRAFLAQRKKRRDHLRQSRLDFSQLRKQLKRVHKNKKYRINGNKEFDLR